MVVGGNCSLWYHDDFDLVINEITITSEDLPQCMRDSALPTNGLVGLALLAAASLAGGISILRRSRKTLTVA